MTPASQPPGPLPAIDAELVRRLVQQQFPAWANLEIRPVDVSGWDNRTFHLGTAMSVRLPSGAGYARAIAKECEWLPRLAPLLPLPISQPIGLGEPCREFPWPWSICRWLPGETAAQTPLADASQFAADLAGFLRALQAVDLPGGPEPGPDNTVRGGSLGTFDAAVQQALADLAGVIDTRAATEIWRRARASEWSSAPVWVHGDVAAGNLLVANGKLCGVIDFGQLVVGDPACDLVMAWTFFDAPAREVFREQVGLDDATWDRAAGWALWKALIVHAGHVQTSATETHACRRALEQLLLWERV